MSNVSFDLFLPEVMPTVQGCADPVAVNAIRNACIDFCTRSNFWQESLEAEDVASTDFPYELQADSGAVVAALLSVHVDGNLLEPVSVAELDARARDWRSHTSTIPRNHYQSNPDEFSLYPTPEVLVSMVVRQSYAPSRAGTVVYEPVYQIHLETIAAGALSRLLAIPAQPWSNPALAMHYTQIFNAGVHSARMDANRSFGTAPLTVQMRRFA